VAGRVAGFVGGVLCGLAFHLFLPFKLANAYWGGNDNPGEWLFYLGLTSCCFLPFTVLTGWLLRKWPGRRQAGDGLFAGIAVAAVVLVVMTLAGYTPPWVGEDPE